MSEGIEIRVGTDAVGQTEPEQSKTTIKIKDVRKSIDGDILFFGHKEIDIALIPRQTKVLAMTKNRKMDLDDVYAAQKRLFQFLRKKGVIHPETIQGSNIYGAMEAEYPAESVNGASPEQLVFLALVKFMETEQEHMEWLEAREKQVEDWLTNPDEEDSTELGEVPHAEEKGTIPSKTQPMYISGPIRE